MIFSVLRGTVGVFDFVPFQNRAKYMVYFQYGKKLLLLFSQ